MTGTIKILAIVQARIDSTRLRAKVLKDICGKPLLWHILNRLKYSHEISETALAIPDTGPNDILEKFAADNRLSCFRGSEEDVLARFYLAAKKFDGKEIVRLTADNPLIDPALLDYYVKAHLNSSPDYTGTRSYPLGINIEICNFASLERSYQEAGQDFEREHVTPYIYQHPDLFKVNIIEANGKFRRPDLRLTVDTEDDLQLIREIYGKLYHDGQIFHLEDVLQLFDHEPEVVAVNARVKQKEMGKQ